MLPDFSPKKTICFVHDLASKIFPDAYSARDKMILDLSFRHAVKAAVIIFISKNTQKDYEKFYPGFKNRSHVIYPGYDTELYKTISNPKDVLNINSKYILYLGRLESRKNVKNLVLAYKLFRKKTKLTPKLVLAGKEGFGFSEIKTEIDKLDANIKNDIIIPGYIAEKDLPHLYAGAELFVFPSLYEGFGIPILEAMACGTPVSCSKTSSLPEAGGEAALYFDPEKPEEIAETINSVLTNPALKTKMIAKGYEQAKKFSYSKMAKEVLAVINSL
jgi:glycosyltransferase involved in cell wall biosynthesis